MRNDWILDVLTDLRTFADQNGLKASAEHLADTCLVVAAELSNRPSEALSEQAGVHDDRVARLSGGYSAS
ncbi:MAG: hypothetical protein HWE33_12795 [Rhodobacteraceae bacterium]|uniref:hypothetical protein n=1 Tax=Celeribacter TaxID=875170 RepID=UPI001430E213|nr:MULTISPECIES: hypothetical protein [Celeribacter]NIY80516.1 hypothetical protein [Celeribacter sp. HF31]NVK47174.1 hypothetical protein [Paracoccaceae bacterium]